MKTNKIKKYIYFLGLFFLIFPPHILIYGYTFKTVYLFIVLPGIIGGYNYFREKKKNVVVKHTLAFMLFAFFYFCILSGLTLFTDISVIKEILMGFIILFSCYFYVNVYSEMYGNRFITKLFMDLNKAGIIQSVIVIATFLSPNFKSFLYSFIGLTATSHRYLFEQDLIERFQGIVPSGFAFLSTTHALLLAIGIWGFFMSNKRYRFPEIIIFILGQITIFISIALIGRTGFVVFLLFLSALIFYRASYLIKTHFLSKKTIKLVLSIAIIATAIFVSTDLSKYKKNIDFAFDLVIEYSQTKEISGSVATVINYGFFFPDNAFNLFLGTGNFGRSDGLPYVYSDVGYVLFINGAGIFGMLIGYSFYFIGFYYAYKYRRLSPYLSLFVTVYLIMLIIVNLKDYYYVSQVGYSQIFFIMICVLGKRLIDGQPQNDYYSGNKVL